MNKKYLILILMVIFTGFVFNSCERDVLEEPELNGPAGYHYVVDGAANPTILFFNGSKNPKTTITVYVYDHKGAPVANRYVFLEQREYENTVSRVDWGFFNNGKSTIGKYTDSEGKIVVTYYGPLHLEGLTPRGLYIKATLADDREMYFDEAPCDYIALYFIGI